VDIISYSIPVFFLLIGVEIWVSNARGLDLYRFADSISDLSCGLLNQVIAVFTAATLLGIYWVTWEHLAIFEIPADRWWSWALAIVGIDFTYYWFHRMAHEHNVLWVTHTPHHSSEEYNLTVALRQGAVEPLAALPFRLPLAILGIPPLMYVAANAINTVYQFWVHTRAIDRLGPLELLLVTPSHHRVHHGCDPKYLDRNYSGMFIIWDKLFGTFQVEEEPPTYGVVRPLESWNPVWANFEHAARVHERAKGLPWREQAALWWAGPTVFADPNGPQVVAGRPQYDARVSPRTMRYLFAHFLAVIGATVVMLFGASSLDGGQLGALAAFVTVSVVALGAIMDDRWWAAPLEGLRLASIPALGVILLGVSVPVLLVGGAVSGASVVFLGLSGSPPIPSSAKTSMRAFDALSDPRSP
jgi:sterol desaturase/sphingolipid hydroxylase (fatty acid hydroxylase superfamily)